MSDARAVDLQERVTDDERRGAAADIEAAVGDGLLDLDEADARLALAWSARTAGDLARARADLPSSWLAARPRAEAAERAARQARQTLPAHVRSWLGLVALLVTIWALTTPGGYFWPIWPALGSGLCLAGHVSAARRARQGPVRRLTA
jgi:hypothetical protein